jgi:hypothetical protein
VELRAKAQDDSCILRTRRQPAESLGGPSDWRSRCELPDLLPGYKKKEGLDTVEGSAPSKMAEEPTCSFSVRVAGNVGALATRDSFTLSVGNRNTV